MISNCLVNSDDTKPWQMTILVTLFVCAILCEILWAYAENDMICTKANTFLMLTILEVISKTFSCSHSSHNVSKCSWFALSHYNRVILLSRFCLMSRGHEFVHAVAVVHKMSVSVFSCIMRSHNIDETNSSTPRTVIRNVLLDSRIKHDAVVTVNAHDWAEISIGNYCL